VHDGIGAAHAVSLEPWDGRDPDRTRLLIDLVLPNGFGVADDVEPGSVDVNVVAFDPADPRYTIDDENSRPRIFGATLRAVRLALAAQDGVAVDPDGRSHTVSLDEWDSADPDSTWLLIGFGHQQRSTPVGMRGTRYDIQWHWRAMDALRGGDHP
jgi:hypothetical protein